MSIFAYTGLPGSGKSYDTVKNVILPGLRRGRRIVTNIPLHRDAVRRITPKGEIVEFPLEAVQANPALIDEYVTPGSVFVLDEAWRMFPAGQKVDRVPVPFKQLLAEHRHMVDSKKDSTFIVLCTQDLAQIGAFARQLVEMTYYHEKLTTVGARGSYRIDVVQGPMTGQTAPSGRRVNSVLGKYRPDVFACYKSHTMSEAGSDGADERPVDQRGTIWHRKSVWIGFAAVIGFVAFGVSSLASLVDSYGGTGSAGDVVDQPAGAAVESQAPAVAAPVSSAEVAAQPSRVREADALAYRVVGSIRNRNRSDDIAILSLGDQVFPIPFSLCHEPVPDQYVCTYDGHRITAFESMRL